MIISCFGRRSVEGYYPLVTNSGIACKRTRILCTKFANCQACWAGFVSQSYVEHKIIMQNQGGRRSRAFPILNELESCNIMDYSIHGTWGGPSCERAKKKWVDSLTRSVEDRMISDLILRRRNYDDVPTMHRGSRLEKASLRKPTQTRGVYWKNGRHLVATPAVAPGRAGE